MDRKQGERRRGCNGFLVEGADGPKLEPGKRGKSGESREKADGASGLQGSQGGRRVADEAGGKKGPQGTAGLRKAPLHFTSKKISAVARCGGSHL